MISRKSVLAAVYALAVLFSAGASADDPFIDYAPQGYAYGEGLRSVIADDCSQQTVVPFEDCLIGATEYLGYQIITSEGYLYFKDIVTIEMWYAFDCAEWSPYTCQDIFGYITYNQGLLAGLLGNEPPWYP